MECWITDTLFICRLTDALISCRLTDVMNSYCNLRSIHHQLSTASVQHRFNMVSVQYQFNMGSVQYQFNMGSVQHRIITVSVQHKFSSISLIVRAYNALFNILNFLHKKKWVDDITEAAWKPDCNKQEKEYAACLPPNNRGTHCHYHMEERCPGGNKNMTQVRELGCTQKIPRGYTI